MSVFKAIVLLAEGAEEMETVITVDILRRGGISVILAGVDGPEPVVCSRNVKLVPDKSLEEALKDEPFDIVVCPGGIGGAKKLSNSAVVGQLLRRQYESKKLLGAVCAGPTAFLAHGVALNREITSYPTFAQQFDGTYKYQERRVVRDENVITSRAPGTCFEFALSLVEALVGEHKRNEVSKAMLVK